jgi:hypothetical protein
MYDDLPITFLNELAHNKRAMQVWARLSEPEKAALCARAAHLRSRDSQRLLVLSLDDTERANEYR